MESFSLEVTLLEFFWASLGEFGQKSFATPKICLVLHLCGVEPAELFEIAVDRKVFQVRLLDVAPTTLPRGKAV